MKSNTTNGRPSLQPSHSVTFQSSSTSAIQQDWNDREFIEVSENYS
jgi:hypothetical protein